LGKIAINVLANGDGWSVADLVCGAGPGDRPFEERHSDISIAVVLEGSFQYRSECSSEVMSPGSLLLGSYAQTFECSHEHGYGDRCVAFHYTPEFFERAGAECVFPVLRIPPIATSAPWVARAARAVHLPAGMSLEDLAHGLAGAVLEVLQTNGGSRHASASDERRISLALRFIEANLSNPLPLDLLASIAKMSGFHFVRVFKKVTSVTPHQYILRARLREAATRLQSSVEPVLEIALDTGFQDLSNFCRTFRTEFGVSPRVYRGL
jgi:AraC family transcriptional regulator